jgi:hypothetical protein
MNAMLLAHAEQLRAALAKTAIRVPREVLDALMRQQLFSTKPRDLGKGNKASCCHCDRSSRFVYEFAGLPFCPICVIREDTEPARCECGHFWMAHSAGRRKCFECACQRFVL